jgi:hypothetical protein
MPNGQSICRNENNFKFILYVLENANEYCISYEYFISINCLQMYFMKILFITCYTTRQHHSNYFRNITLAWLVRHCTSLQLHVRKWMKGFVWPQYITFCRMNRNVYNFLRPPKDPTIICMESTQVQLGKFPIITSYYFVLGGGLELMM